MTDEHNEKSLRIQQTAGIVSAYVSNNHVPRDELAALISTVFAALSLETTAEPIEVEAAQLVPAVSVKKSVTPDYLVCLEDGKRFKSLKRHLMTHYDLTPKEYRQKWGLPDDYPMVAASYAAKRSELAKSFGLGRKAASAPEPASVAEETAPKRRASRKASSEVDAEAA
ncbi:MucR family transcriptional regulator [Aureimonas pseudogalii]|uniref:Putative transcriptional regulator n=1 Tax=Aureimonas pseudogalii TaxID=1744844 RepID=A0A7W6H2Y7_9HYPH|nr:MucR family transcriptional regulator [Aureimonas pseudogalii]MBB3997160.1 putative transcriptional regulator [Aureimonas pseudogalii]